MPGRATTLEELRRIQAPLVTAEGVARGLTLQLRPTDVVISPFAKCGTTWLQQTVHGLRTRGDMNFDDISRVVPWIEMSTDLGLNLDAEQVANPRAFKSHLAWDRVPKGGRYVVSLRHPGDALVSAYRFMEDWFFEAGTISLEDHARETFLNPRPGHGYWAHLLSWWQHRDDDNVLLLTYEDMRADFPRAVRRIAPFIGVPLDDDLLDLVVHQSSLAFMTEHEDKFDDLLMRQRSEQVCGLPPGSDSSKVRDGKVGSRKIELSSELHTELDARWAELITPHTGLATYEDLLDALHRTT